MKLPRRNFLHLAAGAGPPDPAMLVGRVRAEARWWHFRHQDRAGAPRPNHHPTGDRHEFRGLPGAGPPRNRPETAQGRDLGVRPVPRQPETEPRRSLSPGTGISASCPIRTR
jgi:hypothetical protein